MSDLAPLWLKALRDAVKKHLPREFVGQIEINAFKGGITNINLKESFRGDTAT